jgi:hypothetical protein
MTDGFSAEYVYHRLVDDRRKARQANGFYLLQCSVERRAASRRFAMMDEMLEVIKQTPRGRSC